MTAFVSMRDAPFGCVAAPRAVPAGTRICDIVASDTPGAMARLGGQWLLRRDWSRALASGDRLEVHLVAAGGEQGRKQAIGIVLTIAAFAVFGPGGAAGLQGWQSTAALLASSLAINAVLGATASRPSPAGRNAGEGAAPSYTTSLTGNRAALDEAIPVGYGYSKIFPRFAAEPYVRYDNDTSDQYYHALMCLGMGQYEVHRVLLDDTLLEHFNPPGDTVVEYAILAPGAAPTLVSGSVATAIEVSGQELAAGVPVGGFVACNARQTAADIEVDFAFEGGLGDATAGTPPSSMSVSIRTQARPVDAWGLAEGAWVTLGVETITAATTSAVRRTYTYTLASAARVEVRVIRLTAFDADPLVLNTATWIGLRAVLTQASPLAASATHVEVKMRANKTLNALSQRRFAVMATRKVRAWSAGGGWAAAAASRSIAWALADKWTNAEYGDGLADGRIDLQGLYALDQVWAERQDRLDLFWDAATDSESADQTMARAGRARCFWRNGVRTLARDEPQVLPVTAYTSRDLLPGTARISCFTDAAKVPDAIIVEYLDYQSWDWDAIVCPAPGVDVEDVVRPEYMRLPGVIGPHQAQREGLYEAAARSLRRIYVSGDTELQGLLPAFGSAVIWAPALRGWGAAGDVVAYDAGSLTATLSEPPVWSPAGVRYVTLVRDDGSVTDPIEVTPGAGNDVILLDVPDFTPSTDAPDRERTRYTFGSLVEHRRVARVLGIRPQSIGEDGATVISISGVLEDDAVHEVDIDLLPVGEEIQDDIASPNAEYDEDPASFYEVSIVDKDILYYLGGAADWQLVITFSPTGVLTFTEDGISTWSTPAYSSGDQPSEWLIGRPFDASAGAAFEIYVSAYGSPYVALYSGTTGSWLSLSTARSWAIGSEYGSGASSKIHVSIRSAVTEEVLGEADIIVGWDTTPPEPPP